MIDLPVELDEENMEVARENSFLCEMFQLHGFKCGDKQIILRRLFEDYKQKRLEKNAQENNAESG